MVTRTYRTNLNCGQCVAAVAPHLNGDGRIKRWSVDTAGPDKVLTVEGEGVAPAAVERLVAAAGFRVLGEVASAPAGQSPAGDAQTPPTSYYPIALLFGFLVLAVGLLEFRDGAVEWPRAMARFMGGFFLAFSFFKLLDVRAFADAYAGYDVIAGRWPAYGYAYPFLELLLGVAYLSGVYPTATNVATLVVMSAGTIGVVRALLARRKIRCACLGSVFSLPMSTVTLAEDLLMVGMAAGMLIEAGHI